ncbi:MAG: hypothetical protein M1818_000594 [Claussenomyces sp. TS43310]|nr:MAG: hypothetical protein M1818_000594 [Claussenomyces sp. TS43310]
MQDWRTSLQECDQTTTQLFLHYICDMYKVGAFGTAHLYFHQFRQLSNRVTGKDMDRTSQRGIQGCRPAELVDASRRRRGEDGDRKRKRKQKREDEFWNDIETSDDDRSLDGVEGSSDSHYDRSHLLADPSNLKCDDEDDDLLRLLRRYNTICYEDIRL